MTITVSLAPEFTVDEALAEANRDGFAGIAGTAHTEDHGTLTMVVSMRRSQSSVQADS